MVHAQRAPANARNAGRPPLNTPHAHTHGSVTLSLSRSPVALPPSHTHTPPACAPHAGWPTTTAWAAPSRRAHSSSTPQPTRCPRCPRCPPFFGRDSKAERCPAPAAPPPCSCCPSPASGAPACAATPPCTAQHLHPHASKQDRLAAPACLHLVPAQVVLVLRQYPAGRLVIFAYILGLHLFIYILLHRPVGGSKYCLYCAREKTRGPRAVACGCPALPACACKPLPSARLSMAACLLAWSRRTQLSRCHQVVLCRRQARSCPPCTSMACLPAGYSTRPSALRWRRTRCRGTPASDPHLTRRPPSLPACLPSGGGGAGWRAPLARHVGPQP